MPHVPEAIATTADDMESVEESEHFFSASQESCDDVSSADRFRLIVALTAMTASRLVHDYAADALCVSVAAHNLREWQGKYSIGERID